MKYKKVHHISMFLIVLLCVGSAPVYPQVELIQLKSKEGTTYEISKDAALLSNLMLNLYGDYSPEEGEVFKVPLAGMNDTTLRSAIKYLNMALEEYKKEVPGFNPKVEEERKEFQEKVIKALGTAIKDDLNRAKDPVGQVVVFIKTGHHLDFPELSEAASMEAAKIVSWENLSNKYWDMLSRAMNNRIAYWMVQNIRGSFFPLTLNETRTLKGHTRNVWKAQFSPDGLKIVTASADKTASIWDVVTGKRIRLLRGHVWQVLDAQFSPDGTQIVTGSDDNTVRVWQTTTGDLIHTLVGHEHGVLSTQFSPDGTKILTFADDEIIKIWNASTGELVHSFQEVDEPILSAKFFPDVTKILTADPSGNEVKIRNAQTGQIIYNLTSLGYHTDRIESAYFSPDGTKIVTASKDWLTKIWDVKTSELIHSLRGDKGIVKSARFSTNGTMVINASVDHTSKIWDVKTGQLLLSLEGHNDEVTDAQFNHDDTKVVTTSMDETAKIWDISQPWVRHYINADNFTLPQAHLIVTLSVQKRQDKPMIFSKLKYPHIPTNRLKQIFKTFDANTRKALTKRFNIQEEPPEEILEEGLEQLGL